MNTTRDAIIDALKGTSGEIREDGLDVDWGGACPVQGNGTVDGMPVYFRARGEWWSFSVAATSDGDADGVDGVDDPPGAWMTDGEADLGPSHDTTPIPAFAESDKILGRPTSKASFRASWMPAAESERHIRDSVAAYRAWRASRA